MEWNQTFGGTGDDCAGSVLETADGGFILAGWTFSYGAGDEDFWLVKTDATGTPMWNKTFGGNYSDMATSLIKTADGGYAFAGQTQTYSQNTFFFDFWLIKTDASGQHEWNQSIGGIVWQMATSLIQTTDGGYALAGHTTSYGAGIGETADFWLVKTNASGQHEWNVTYGGMGWDWAYSLIQTADGGYALAGSTESYGVGEQDAWLVKTDASGQHEWNQTFGGSYFDEAASVIQTMDGGFVLAGTTESFGAGNGDFWLIKTDTNGQEEWNQTFGGSYDEMVWAVIQTDDGGFILAGDTISFGTWGPSPDIWLVKTDTNGQHEWNQTFGGALDEGLESTRPMTQTTDGGLILVGWTESYGVEGQDAWLLKLSEVEATATTQPPMSSTIATEEPTDTSTPGTTAYPPISLIVLVVAGLMIRLKRRKE